MAIQANLLYVFLVTQAKSLPYCGGELLSDHFGKGALHSPSVKIRTKFSFGALGFRSIFCWVRFD